MPNRRMTRVNELLHREIGSALYRVLVGEDVDMSAITVTHVVTSPDLRNAQVLVSIRDHADDRNQIMALLKRHRVEIQKLVSKNVVLKYTPRLTISLDTSLEEGDHILDLLSDIGEIPDRDYGGEDGEPESKT